MFTYIPILSTSYPFHNNAVSRSGAHTNAHIQLLSSLFFSHQHALYNTQLVILVSNAVSRESAPFVKWHGGPIPLDWEKKKNQNKHLSLILQRHPGDTACLLEAWVLGYIWSKLKRCRMMYHFWEDHLAGKHAREREKKLWVNDRAN